ncbi:unnamed protein product [Hyaloperonospora brassicae]|uniref:Uncharacterized protein n=1 Tax=Hyaloperonospora brassicae TaxID=162125 RepID=A0AAV0TFI9_HYABA|nr:unnamed protein product [Hyaloperonospora brassicae]
MRASTPSCHRGRPSAHVTPAQPRATTQQQPDPPNVRFASPSFLSPASTCGSKPAQVLTLEDHPTLKGSRLMLQQETPRHPPQALPSPRPFSANRCKARAGGPNPARVLEDISNTARRDSGRDDPTTKRKLAFCTPIKALGRATGHVASTSGPTLASLENSCLSSEPEPEVSDIPVTIAAATTTSTSTTNHTDSATREQVPAPVPSQVSNTVVHSRSPAARKAQEYHFSVTSTVSSVAVAPNGSFLVAGFYNGMVYLYPLTTDSLVFHRGVLLDQILPRGMYTQIMVTVSIPTDGRFIFAGVYRGSTDIRAIEVDSIELPTAQTEGLAPKRGTNAVDPTTTTSMALLSADDSDESDRDGDLLTDVFRSSTAQVVAHTFSDAKLKGFAAAKCLYHETSRKMEYRLLCGIGIKNVHMWRFYQKKSTGGTDLTWSWECVFDKQTNGISLEFISFHPTIANQFISKSEHQNVRIWHLEEDYDTVGDSVTIRKQSHTDVKQTLDSVAVYGDYAYGGSESLSVIDLQAAVRMDLDLPLSQKEQRAQREALIKARNANSLRAWNPRGSRRRGAEDTNGQRHMRTVSKIAGQDASPFTVGMCSDGSVFIHQPTVETGIATPLDYVEGYEQFFVDPSLDFQAQFSDLTRVNTSGLLAVLPFPEMEKAKWMVVAANQNQLLVQSLDAFLHRNQRENECFRVKTDSRDLTRGLGEAESYQDSSCSSDSDVSDESAAKEKHRRQKKKIKAVLKRSHQDGMLKYQVAERKFKRNRHDSEKTTAREKTTGRSGARREAVPLPDSRAQETAGTRHLVVTGTRDKVGKSTTAVATPKYSTPRDGGKLWTSAASPVVSISSSSDSSNPNSPEHPVLSGLEKRLLVLKKHEETLSSVATLKSRQDNERLLGDSTIDMATAVTSLSSSSTQAISIATDVSSEKKATRRMRTQALFTEHEGTEDGVTKEKCEVTQAEMKESKTVSLSSKKPAGVAVSDQRVYVGSSKPARLQEEKQGALASEQKELTEADCHVMQSVGAKDAELEEELERLEQSEPEFMSVPFVSDKGSLLAAAMYRYSDPASEGSSDSKVLAIADTDADFDRAVATSEQTNLLMQFSRQNERLRMNFLTERERVYKHPDCGCASAVYSKRSSSISASGPMNWRRNVAHDYHRQKQLKRRHKKLLATKLHQLHANYASQIQELYAMQQMEANALRARQQFQHLHKQLRRQASKSDGVSLAPTTAVALPLQYSTMPDHFSDARFPYPQLLS